MPRIHALPRFESTLGVMGAIKTSFSKSKLIHGDP